MKKVFLLIIAILLSTIMLAACGGGGMPDGENVITIGLPKQAMVSSYGSDNALTAWLEEQTGYDIEIIEFATKDADYKTQLATMVASGEKLPDILFSFKVGDSLRSDYGQQGYFIDLKPYFNDPVKSKNVWDKLNQLPEQDLKWILHKMEDADTGAYYALPNTNQEKWDTLRYQPFINQNWLDKLNLEVPTNVEQLINVLTHFRDDDPNGNGEKDEIPCMGNTSDMGGDVVNWLINMKMQVDMSSWVNIDANGTAYAPAVTNEYREALKWVHDLMEQDLISKLSVTTSGNNLEANLASGDYIGLFVGHPTIVVGDYEAMSKWTPVPIWGYSYMGEHSGSYHTFITEDCDNPDAAWEILMLLYTDEGEYRCRFGEKGEFWDWADEGAVNVFGTPAVIKRYKDALTEIQTDSFWRVFTCVGTMAELEMFQVDENTSAAEKAYWAKIVTMINSYEEASKMDTGNITVQHKLQWTDDLKKEAPYRTDVTSLFNTYTDKFCTGQLNPYSDEDWNGYLKELKDATYDKWIQVIQEVVKNSHAHGVY